VQDEHREPLERFIKENLVKPHGFWGRLLLGSQEREHEVKGITACEDGGFFRKCRVFEVSVRGTVLEGKALPSGGSFGLFSVDRDGIRYLNRRQAEVEAIFRAEDRPLEEWSPLTLARFLAATLLRQGNESDDVLTSADALAHYDGGRSGFGGPYVLDDREWDRVRAEFIPPTLGSSPDGWELTFTSVQGWMHMKGTLKRHRFRIGRDFRLSRESTALSRRIFERMPAVIY